MLAFDASTQGTSSSPLKSPCSCRPSDFSALFTPSGLKQLFVACRMLTLFSNPRGACIALTITPVSSRVLISAHTAASRAATPAKKSLLSNSFPLLLPLWGLHSYPAHTFTPQQVQDGGAGYIPVYFELLIHALALQDSWDQSNPEKPARLSRLSLRLGRAGGRSWAWTGLGEVSVDVTGTSGVFC